MIIIIINLKMKLSNIFILYTLIVIAKGAWLTAAIQPLILGFGAVFTALNLDVLQVELPFISKSEKTP